MATWFIRKARHVAWVVGRRGAALIVLSLVFCLYGIMLFTADRSEPPPTALVILTIAPLWAWGVVWIAASLVALVQSIYGRLRSTSWAFASLTFVSGIWASGYIAGWIVMEPPRDPRGWLNGALWMSVFMLTIIMSGWRDVPRFTDPNDESPKIETSGEGS